MAWKVRWLGLCPAYHLRVLHGFRLLDRADAVVVLHAVCISAADDQGDVAELGGGCVVAEPGDVAPDALHSDELYVDQAWVPSGGQERRLHVPGPQPELLDSSGAGRNATLVFSA